MPPYWLMKSEPGECSIDGALVAPEATVGWIGVRSYQARNFMRDQMQPGDGVLFYHSSGAQPGIAGVARVARGTRPDPTQFDPASPYFDAASTPEAPRWLLAGLNGRPSLCRFTASGSPCSPWRPGCRRCFGPAR